jgi:NhaP-type Na+/H+ or K+/H+ antiporter
MVLAAAAVFVVVYFLFVYFGQSIQTQLFENCAVLDAALLQHYKYSTILVERRIP